MNTSNSHLGIQKGTMRILGDNPIRTTKQDVLERARIAEKFARQVCRLDTTEGAVVGVFGPWGSGKTSFIHLAKKIFEHEEVPVLDFNPWLFSGTEQLVERFITELSTELKLVDLEKIGEALLEYGDVFSGSLGTIVKMSGKYYQRREGGIQNKRKQVASVLRERRKPIIVVLDDVDRLTAPEIREIFKLVRLTASFPNLIYLVCCDRKRVEQALDETGIEGSGSEYLEKIIQLPFQLPEVPRHLLAAELHQAIEDNLVGIENPGPVDNDEWPVFFNEIIRPLVRNMRDVRRYAIAVRHTLENLDGQVACNDVLALEAIRIFLPDMFKRLPGAIETLTMPNRFIYERLEKLELEMGNETEPTVQLSKWFRTGAESLIEAAGGNERDDARKVSEAVIDRMFPVGEHIRQLRTDGGHMPFAEKEKERLSLRRVGHEHIFRLYLERVLPPDLHGNRHAEHVISLMADRKSLYEFLQSLKSTEWHTLIWNPDLFYERKISRQDLENLVFVLLERWSEFPNQLAGWIMQDKARPQLQNIIEHFLASVSDPGKADAMVRRILSELTFLSSRLMLVEILRNREDSDSGIVPESTLQEHENMLGNDIFSASHQDLENECDLLRVLYYAKGYVTDRVYHTDISIHELTIMVLLSALQAKSGSVFLGDLPVALYPALNWDGLVKLYGNTEQLRKRISDLTVRVEELIPFIERRIPYDDFRNLLELAEQNLQEVQPGMVGAST